MIDILIARVARAIEVLLASAFICAVGLNFVNVIGRYALGRSILWADEVQIFIMIGLTFIGAAIVTWRQQHLRMDVLVQALPASIRAALKLIECVLLLTVASFVFYLSSDYTLRMFDIGRTSDTGGIPMWIPHGALALGIGLIAVLSLLQLVRGLRYGFGEHQPPVSGGSQEGQL